MRRRRGYDDRLSVTHPGCLVEHHGRLAVVRAARRTHSWTVIIIGNSDAQQGSHEATYDGTVMPAHHIAQYSTRTGANKCAG